MDIPPFAEKWATKKRHLCDKDDAWCVWYWVVVTNQIAAQRYVYMTSFNSFPPIVSFMYSPEQVNPFLS